VKSFNDKSREDVYSSACTVEDASRGSLRIERHDTGVVRVWEAYLYSDPAKW
jgi:hypothetical protein